MEIMGLEEFLVWLAGGGAVIAFSWLAEFFNWFSGVSDPKKKKLIFFGFETLIAVGAQAIIVYVPEEVILEAAPWFLTVALIFGLNFLGEAFHNINKK